MDNLRFCRRILEGYSKDTRSILKGYW